MFGIQIDAKKNLDLCPACLYLSYSPLNPVAQFRQWMVLFMTILACTDLCRLQILQCAGQSSTWPHANQAQVFPSWNGTSTDSLKLAARKDRSLAEHSSAYGILRENTSPLQKIAMPSGSKKDKKEKKEEALWSTNTTQLHSITWHEKACFFFGWA